MSETIRAIYRKGQLCLLDLVNLQEGEEIQLMILSDAERVITALGDLLVDIQVPPAVDIDEAALAREIEEGFHGRSPLSDAIIEERREGR